MSWSIVCFLPLGRCEEPLALACHHVELRLVVSFSQGIARRSVSECLNAEARVVRRPGKKFDLIADLIGRPTDRIPSNGAHDTSTT
ncbi:hypothetical protein [Pengzhenrongella sicca]|uniref:Uncharacterized protein n=1 Tax=Pengzhenrongella sicca TaxID=2819238 RepID=A0A8A4ZGB7_9MICO|nr:hypothetical protein [Pengzhenrongella sicca]QTE31072.1 hypothetical protein J4E96_09195 [Pengzhenrongella sicca]